MQVDIQNIRRTLSTDLTDVLVRLGLIIFVIYLSARIFSPFAGLMLTGLVLAVALYPLHRRIVGWLGGRQGLGATVLIASAILLIAVPTAMLGSSFASHIHDTYVAFSNNEVSVPAPSPSVAEWPLVGEPIYAVWNAASDDLPALLAELQPQLRHFTQFLLGLAANTAGSILLIVGSLIIAGIIMAYGERGTAAIQRIFHRLTGAKRGAHLQALSTATIRSVATGVVGVAFIQALLLGIGFLLAGIPAAGVWALIVLLLGIMQLPVIVVSLPAIAYLWWSGDGSTVSNVLFTVYLIVAGFADNVLKPMLLGRGVDAPMPVVLLGALGGMVSGGLIGLFLGAVILAVGYSVFMEWVDEPPYEDGAGADSPDQTESGVQAGE